MRHKVTWCSKSSLSCGPKQKCLFQVWGSHSSPINALASQEKLNKAINSSNTEIQPTDSCQTRLATMHWKASWDCTLESGRALSSSSNMSLQHPLLMELNTQPDGKGDTCQNCWAVSEGWAWTWESVRIGNAPHFHPFSVVSTTTTPNRNKSCKQKWGNPGCQTASRSSF